MPVFSQHDARAQEASDVSTRFNCLFQKSPQRRRLSAKTMKQDVSSPSPSLRMGNNKPCIHIDSVSQFSNVWYESMYTDSQFSNPKTPTGPANPGPRKSLTGLLGSNLGLGSRPGARTQLDFNMEPSF